MRVIVLLSILLMPAFAAKSKDRDWQSGVIFDSQSSRETRETGAITTGTVSPDYGRRSTIQAETHTTHANITHTQMLLEGDEYSYVVDKQSWRSWDGKPIVALASGIASLKQHSCHVVIGDTVQYAQSRGKLYVIDVDGHECKFEIVRQERLRH